MVVEATRPVASVARELQLNEQTLRNWVNEYRRTHAADEPPLTVSERARLLCRAGRLSLSVRLTCVPACRSTVTARPSITPRREPSRSETLQLSGPDPGFLAGQSTSLPGRGGGP